MRAVVFVLIYSLLQTVAGVYSRNIYESLLMSQTDFVSSVGKAFIISLCNFQTDESTKLDAPISLVKYDYDYLNFSNPINLYDTAESGHVHEKKVVLPIRDIKIYLYDYRIDNVQENHAGLYACAYKLNKYKEGKLIRKFYNLQLSNFILKERS